MLTSLGRHRKVKCCEERPRCQNCLKSSFECVWPTSEQGPTRARGFKIKKVPKARIDFVFYNAEAKSDKQAEIVEEVPLTWTPKTAALSPSPQYMPMDSDSPATIILLLGEPESTQDLCLNSDAWGEEEQEEKSIVLRNVNVDPLDIPDHRMPLLGTYSFSGSTSWFPGNRFSSEDAKLYHAFVKGFLPSISPQVSHPSLTPSAVFVLKGLDEPFMKGVFEACGAAYLSTKFPEFSIVARKRYSQCLVQFANELTKSNGEFAEWMVATVLLFCLRDKMVGALPQHPASHLSKAIELIRTLRKLGKHTTVSAKFLVESSLFNYSVVLLTGGKDAKRILPSPFELFDEWRDVYEYQPYSCSVPWMNYPVFGAAGRGFELAAKASWLVGDYPLPADRLEVACRLLGETYTLQKPEMRLEGQKVGLTEDEISMLRDSTQVLALVKMACQILLNKLINPNLELLHSIIQEKVYELVEIITVMHKTANVWVICGWPLLIIGLCAIEDSHREMIVAQCYRCAEIFLTYYLTQIGELLEKAWGTPQEPGLGWDILFEASEIFKLCL